MAEGSGLGTRRSSLPSAVDNSDRVGRHNMQTFVDEALLLLCIQRRLGLQI